MKTISLLSRDEYVKSYLTGKLNENEDASGAEGGEETPTADEEFINEVLLCCAYIESNRFSEEPLNEGLKEVWGKIKDKSSSMIKGLKDKLGKYKAEFDQVVNTVAAEIVKNPEAKSALEKVKVSNPQEVLSQMAVHEAKVDLESLKKTIGNALQVLGVTGGAGTTLILLITKAIAATTGLFITPALFAPLAIGLIIAIIAKVATPSGENLNVATAQ